MLERVPGPPVLLHGPLAVTLPFVSRPVALGGVLAALALKGGRTKPERARELVDLLAERFTDREVHIVADAGKPATGCARPSNGPCRSGCSVAASWVLAAG